MLVATGGEVKNVYSLNHVAMLADSINFMFLGDPSVLQSAGITSSPRDPIGKIIHRNQ